MGHGRVENVDIITEFGTGDPKLLSTGISEALITTVVGLAIAIPALVGFNYFNHKVEDLVLEIEKHSNALLDRFHRLGRETTG